MQKLRDGRVVVVGGLLEGVANGLPNVDLYDPKTGRWASGSPLHVGRYWVSCVSLADGRLLVSGGQGPNGGAALRSTEIYDPLSDSWTQAAPMAQVRIGHQLALLPDGRVLSAGGYDGTADGKLSSAEIYDPARNSWSSAGKMSEGRLFAVMQVLRNGKVLIAGGAGVSSADLYDPRTNRWTPTGSMSVDRFSYQGGLLQDGKVLVTGGRTVDSSGATDMAEVYDPATGRWTRTEPMGAKRSGHAMVIVKGVPLVIGGENLSTFFDDTEYYDAAAGAWRPGPRLSMGRTYPLAALLDDGRVLAAGGRYGLRGGRTLGSAEVLSAWGSFASSEPNPAARTPVPAPRPAIALDARNLDSLPVPAASRPNTYAVVIGIERYRETLPRADFAASDAKLTAEYFRRVLGVPEENLALLSDDRATKSDFEKYFERWLPNRVEAGDEVYVYFSGHGAPNPKSGESYLVPFDADPTYIEQAGYPIKKLYAQLAKLPAAKVVLILDSCFSGSGGRSVIAQGARPLVTVVESGVPRPLIVITASSGDQISNSYQEKRHGLFTYFFLRGLKEKGPDFRAVYDYLKPEVSRVARRQYNSDQEPQWRQGK
ncbi:MAG: caspase family protein [Elusimicrobia bacterium]|nr:caspase family protein [Elusimicrobiota bacterium]